MSTVPYYVREIKKGQVVEEQDNRTLSPRIMIASAGSNRAANRVSLGLLAIWREQNYQPMAYSIGPRYDFLHALSLASGQETHTLDSWFHDEEQLSYLLTHYSESSRISLLHARQDYFDTLMPMQASWSEEQTCPPGSPAELARLSKTPVIIVIDAREFNFTKLAFFKGVLDFRQREVIAGFILAGFDEKLHKEVQKQMEAELELPLLGTVSLPLLEDDIPALAGVMPKIYEETMRKKIEALRKELMQSLDLQRIRKIAEQAPALSQDFPQKLFDAQRVLGFEDRKYRLALAFDEAFSFYYQENMDLLEEMGAEIIRFSPLQDPILPPDLDGIYLGSGKLLEYISEASDNESMLNHIYRKAQQGVPILAEGTASMYLAKAFVTPSGRRWPLLGILPSEVYENKEAHVTYYSTMTARREDLLAMSGTQIPCVYQNQFRFDPEGASYRNHTKGIGYRMEGFSNTNIWASQASLHFYAEPMSAARFTMACRQVMEKRWSKEKPGLQADW